jgi:hypothetical protein
VSIVTEHLNEAEALVKAGDRAGGELARLDEASCMYLGAIAHALIAQAHMVGSLPAPR